MITEKLQVKTPTKEDYIEVVQCMLDNGNVWMSEEEDVLEKYWNIYKEKTIVYLGFCKDNTITYSCGDLLDGFNTYTTPEFIDKYDKLAGTFKWLYGPIEEKELEDNNKTMNIKKFVKTLTLSKEDKLLREYGLQNDCGDFTEEARELVINKIVEENKAYLVEIATKLEEEDKK